MVIISEVNSLINKREKTPQNILTSEETSPIIRSVKILHDYEREEAPMKFKELRLAANLTQKDVADELKVDRSTVAYWENGTAMPRAEQLPKLADLYHCTIDALFGREAARDTA